MKYQIGERVIIPCWMQGIRRQKSIAFISMRDGWSQGQAVVFTKALLSRLDELAAGHGVELLGTVRESGQSRYGHELEVEAIRFEGDRNRFSEIDLSKKEISHSSSFELDHAVTLLRRPERRFVLRLSSLLTTLFREYLNKEGFTEVHTPKINRGSMEGGSSLFELDYFGERAFLAQSPQLHKQIMVGIFQNVYETGPVFRAEKHATSRHLNEYTSLDVEMGFIHSHRDLMSFLNRLLPFMMNRAREKMQEWPEKIPLPWPALPESIPILDFKQARKLCAEKGISGGEKDLSPAEEKYLGQWVLKERNSDFVFIEGYPMAVRPFYTMADEDDTQKSMSFDLLFRGQELITGGQRLHRVSDYEKVMGDKGLNREDFGPYLEAFEAGMPPHGGFAIGLERLVQSLMTMENIRQATAFPRDCKRLQP